MKPFLLLDAAPFCYGPISTLMAVVDHLLKSPYRLVLLASGTALEFAQPYRDHLEIRVCNTESEEDMGRQLKVFRECTLFISNTNPPSVVFAKRHGVPVVCLDTLFWMWDHLEPEVIDADLFIAQNFAGVDANLERLGKGIRRFEKVGPLISTPIECLEAPARENTCLISYGGMESSFTIPGITHRLHDIQTQLLIDVLEDIQPFERYIFCGRGHVMEALAQKHAHPAREFGFQPHADYLRQLQTCGLCLLSPGLTGAYEAVGTGTPTVLMLPQNYSQQLQAQHFLASSEWPMTGVEWRAVYPDFQLPEQMPEAEAIAQLNQLILKFEQDPPAWDRYRQLLREQLQTPLMPTASPSVSSGAARAAELIVSFAAELTAENHSARGIHA